MVLGRPGEGKTLLTRLGCRAVAERSLRDLRSRAKAISDIPIPIWLRFEDILHAQQRLLRQQRDRRPDDEDVAVARFGALQVAVDEAIPLAVSRAVHQRYGTGQDAPSASLAARYLRVSLGRDTTWLFIDAPDESGMTAGEGDSCAALAGLSALPKPVRIVMTCRKHDYDRRQMLGQGRPDHRLREYDLEPLVTAQQQGFIREWFRPEPTTDKADDVLALVAGDAEFRDMAGNALMLTFICDTRSRHTIGPGTRRVQLYHLILRDIVRRARTSTPSRENNSQVDQRLRVLREVAWRFFSEDPARTSFEIDLWTDRWSEQCGYVGIAPATFEAEMRAEGLLVSYPGALRFLHRSFFEFLVAARLARLGWEELATQFLANAANDAWRNALTMAIGSLALLPPGKVSPSSADLARARLDAGKAVDRILSQLSDTPGVVVALLGDAVVDAGASSIPPDVCQRLREALLHTMRSDGIDGRDPKVEPRVRAVAGSALGRLGDHRFHGRDLWCLPAFRSDPGPDGKLPPEPLLGFVEIEEGEFWMGSNTEWRGYKAARNPAGVRGPKATLAARRRR